MRGRNRTLPPKVAAAERPKADDFLLSINSGQPYSLVLVDQQLPDQDGLALARMVRTDTRLGATRVILLQGLHEHRAGSTFRSAGVAAALVKPVPASQMFDTVTRVLCDPHSPARPQSAAQGTGWSGPERGEAASTAPILVVEDNPINQQVACGWLRKLGYRADVAANGFEALKFLQSPSYGASRAGWYCSTSFISSL